MNFSEAVKEAGRCFNCCNPRCVAGCPVSTPIPQFIQKLKAGDVQGAGELLNGNNFLSSVTCLVCDQKKQCEGHCIQGIKGRSVEIGRLERYVNENYKAKLNSTFKLNGKSVAVIGSGPSGLAFADLISKNGYDVTIFEKEKLCGGMLRYGIPDFRLDKKIIDNILDKLAERGVKFFVEREIQGNAGVQELLKTFDYVYIATGCGVSKFMGIPGEVGLEDVFGATEFLAEFNSNNEQVITDLRIKFVDKRVVVVGGGNVAMDAARCAQKLGSRVRVVYRRSQEEMPAREDEYRDAIAFGIEFEFLTNPFEVLWEENRVTGLLCNRMQLGAKDASDRASVTVVPDADFVISCNKVIFAVGQKPSWGEGKVKTDLAGRTYMPKVYAGGDLVNGPATVVEAVAGAKRAAQSILQD